jgi:hypothetical protein
LGNLSLVTQFNQWCQNKTLIRLTTVEKGVGHKIHVGNIIFVDQQTHNILFYDLDQKKNYNFSMNEIEDVQPYEAPKQKDVKKENVKKEDIKKEDIKKEDIKKEDIKKEDMKQEKVQGNEARKKLKIDIREKMTSLLHNLPDNELYAIIPLLQLLADKNKKEH